MSGRLLWLPAALKNAGLEVDVVAGWEQRGKLGMYPKVIVLHHTAGSMGRNAPSLNICVNGRAGLPGPLCHILIGRDGTCYVIAAGVANHAGVGSWQGVTGNSRAIGIEVENVGTSAEPWTPELYAVMVRACRALADEAGIPAAMVCGHKEWAPRRKVDPHSIDMRTFRHHLANPPAPELPEDPMAYQLDILQFCKDSYAEAGRNPETKGNRNAIAGWAIQAAESDDPRSVLKFMREDKDNGLGLKPVA